MYKYFKRLIDLTLAINILIIFIIPMIIIAILIKIDSKGPILFKQKRTGLKGKVFNLYKFRSMIEDNDVYDFSKKDQYTKIGNILRKTSLDELPQIINILRGEMSFIGPRPWIVDYYNNMSEKQRHRNDVLPGITGLAQVKGRNNIDINTKINYDLEYIKNYSFIEDIKIVFLTIKTVLSKEGVNAGKNTIEIELKNLKEQRTLLEVIEKSKRII